MEANHERCPCCLSVLAVPIDMRNVSRSTGSGAEMPGTGIGENGDPAFTVTGVPQGIAFHLTQDPISETGGGTPAMSAGNKQGCATLGVMTGGGFDAAASVRRLTPGECEALQGFPRGYTNIPGAADGPRYRALGNSMAVPCMAWIGRRIAAALRRKEVA